MKRKITLLTLALLTAVCAMAQRNFKAQSGSNTLYYEITDIDKKEVAVVKDSDYTTALTSSLIIPSTVINNGITYSVTTIGEDAFEGCKSLTEVTIPNSVTTIGGDAFYGCKSLTEVTIPNSVTTIGSSAFYYCISLTEITIGNSVTTIGSYAFTLTPWAKNQTDEFVIVGAGVLLYYKGDGGSVTIPNSVTTIRESAFYGCKSLTEVTIPNSVTSIGENAFKACESLTEVTIPNSVTSIGYGTFYLCSSLTEITIPNSVTSIGDAAFYLCSSLTEITIPNSVTSIGENAFMYCSGLTEVTIGSGLTDLSELPLYNDGLTEIVVSADNPKYSSIDGILYNKDQDTLIRCPMSKTGSVTIGNSVTTIGDWAFRDCESLIEVTIGNSVTSIGSSAFYNCSSLGKVINKARIPQSNSSSSFFSDESYISLYVPKASIEAYKAAVEWKGFRSIEAIESAFFVSLKVTKKAEIDVLNTYNVADYRTKEWEELQAIFTEAKEEVDLLTTESEIEDFDISGLQAKSDAIKTDAELTEEEAAIEAALVKPKADKKAEVDAALKAYDESDYFPTEWNKLVALFTNYKRNIEASTSLEQVEAFDINYLIRKADAIKTIEIITAIEDVATIKPFTQMGNVLQFAEPTQVVIYSVSGAMLHKGEVVEYQFQAKGVYVVQTENGNYKIIN